MGIINECLFSWNLDIYRPMCSYACVCNFRYGRFSFFGIKKDLARLLSSLFAGSRFPYLSWNWYGKAYLKISWPGGPQQGKQPTTSSLTPSLDVIYESWPTTSKLKISSLFFTLITVSINITVLAYQGSLSATQHLGFYPWISTRFGT